MLCRIKLGCKLDVADIGKYLEGLPKLSSREPFAWLNLAPWTPQWNPKCSWDAADLLRVVPPPGGLTEASSHQQATNSDAQVTIVTSSEAGVQDCQEQAQPPKKVSISLLLCCVYGWYLCESDPVYCDLTIQCWVAK